MITRKQKKEQKRKNELEIAYKLIMQGLTIRQVAKDLYMSKSTLHKHIHEYGQAVLGDFKYNQILEALEFNFNDKHNRGGAVTKQRWDEVKKKYGYSTK